MLFSSGDYGVGDGSSDPENQACQTNNGRNETRFMPTFPARYSHDNLLCLLKLSHSCCFVAVPSEFDGTLQFSSAHVFHSSTSVGGTTNIPEQGIYFSGGGFSGYVGADS